MHEPSYEYLVHNVDGSVAKRGRAIFSGWQSTGAKFVFEPPVTLVSGQKLVVASMVVQVKGVDDMGDVRQ